MPTLLLVPFRFNEVDTLPTLKKSLGKIFNIAVKTDYTEFEYEDAYNVERDQYFSTQIIRDLLNLYSNKDVKVLGITSYDLYIPILTFVFGEAQLEGKIAVVSSFRLDPAFYGLPSDKDLREERLIKESVHELGHTFGLIHCINLDCVMRSSTYVEEIDLKPLSFCSDCQKILSKNQKKYKENKEVIKKLF